MTIGEKIQKLRKEKGMSQEVLADQLKVSRQSISKWELDSSTPELNKIVLISELFCVSTEYLLKDDYKEDKTNMEKTSNLDTYIKGKIFYMISMLFIISGILIAFGLWYEYQEPIYDVLGIIIQLIGVIFWTIGKSISPTIIVNIKLKIFMIILLAFMPLTILTGLLSGMTSPYPTVCFPVIFYYMAVYGLSILLGVILIIRKRKKP